jgi:hypothetical protein
MYYRIDDNTVYRNVYYTKVCFYSNSGFSASGIIALNDANFVALPAAGIQINAGDADACFSIAANDATTPGQYMASFTFTADADTNGLVYASVPSVKFQVSSDAYQIELPSTVSCVAGKSSMPLFTIIPAPVTDLSLTMS